jgi:hypothetical protein
MSVEQKPRRPVEKMTHEEREAEHVRLLREEIEATKSGILKRSKKPKTTDKSDEAESK